MSLDNKVKKQGLIRKSGMAKIDNIMSALFLMMACVTRFYHVHVPPEVVFDEVHFGKFASYYIRRTFYFDVHPPLGRLLLALVSWSFGYDGHFNFTTIGESYIENNVPFLVFRGWTAFCGSLLVVFVYRMLRKMGYTIGAIAATSAVVFDNALVTQSRFILLDSMLMMFVTFTLYAWVSFYKERSKPFSFSWYKWLLLTGIGLGCTMGVKMVGLFTVATVGIATIRDLWELLDTRRKLSMQEWTNHFYARVLCLIIVPIILYLSFFHVHFLVLTKTGPGDNFMSPRFQTTLQGSKMSGDANIVYYGGTVHLKHSEQSCYLHSHLHNYPLKYEDARISSQGQQVTCYGHDDANNAFLILPATNDADIVNKYRRTIAPVPVKDKDFVMLYHTATNCFLITHDVASPLTPTNTEFTCIKDFNKYHNMVFQLNLEKSAVLKTLGVSFKLMHNDTKVAMFVNSKKLPEWAFEQQEINGNKKLEVKDNLWMVEHVSNSLNFTTQPPPDEPNTDIPGFFEKFFELHSRMISSNSKLTKSHPYQSEPWEWFVLHRGISFWQSKSDKQQVYLIGNFFTWWIASALIIVYIALLVLHLLAQKRGVNLFNSCNLTLI